MSDLCYYENNDISIVVTFTDSNGSAIDITGYTVWFTVKERESDIDANAIIQKEVTSHSDPTNGETTIDLTNSDMDINPKTYYYDIQWKDTNDKIKTILKAKFIVKKRITQDTT